jgi:hypothetical protein
MKAHTQYITDEKGKKKAVILDLKEYEKLVRALEDLEDKKAFLSVIREKAIPYGEIDICYKKNLFKIRNFQFRSRPICGPAPITSGAWRG